MTNENVLDLAGIEAASDVEYKTIPVPEWKGSIRLGSLTAEQFLAWAAANEGPLASLAGIRMLTASLVDASGNRIGDESALAKLQAKNPVVLTRLVREALKLNGIEPKEEAQRKNDSGEAKPIASPTV